MISLLLQYGEMMHITKVSGGARSLLVYSRPLIEVVVVLFL